MTVPAVGQFEVMTDGSLPRYSSIGTYPLFYLTMEGETLCAECANTRDREGIDGQEANYENPSLYCDECCDRIESAYAETVKHRICH